MIGERYLSVVDNDVVNEISAALFSVLITSLGIILGEVNSVTSSDITL